MFITIKEFHLPKKGIIDKKHKKTYDESNEKFSPLEEFSKNNKIPIIKYDKSLFGGNKRKQSELVFECLKSEDYQTIRNESDKMKYLLYCHETVEDSHSMLPALKLKHNLRLRNCLPFSISHQGSLSIITATEIAQSLLNKTEIILFFISDCVMPPIKTPNFNNYPKGDCSIFGYFSYEKGMYKLMDYHLENVLHDKEITQWNSADYEVHESQLLHSVFDLMTNVSRNAGSPWVITQTLSPKFKERINDIAMNLNYKLYQREIEKDTNFFGSDVLISLNLLEKTNVLKHNEQILLIFASLDYGVGYYLLSYQK